MTTLRCTGKLLKRLGIRDPGQPPPPDNALGDWFANIIYTPHGHYVLCVSQLSLLPVLTTARDLGSLVPRFMTELGDVLLAIGVRRELIELELSRMEPMHFGRTNSRSVLGTMNDFVLCFRYMLPGNLDVSPLDWSIHLSRTPCGPIDMERPWVLAKQLLKNPHDFRVIDDNIH